ncbi:MAG: hypothetical protein ACN6OP_26860, partial [Pseudomonadales bacterium]
MILSIDSRPKCWEGSLAFMHNLCLVCLQGGRSHCTKNTASFLLISRPYGYGEAMLELRARKNGSP